MNDQPAAFPEDVEIQASLWAARLEGGELSDDQCAQLDHWLTEDDSHRQALAAYCQLSAELETRLPQLMSRSESSAPASPRARIINAWWTIAGLAAAACLAVVLLRTPSPGDSLQRIATAIAECQSVVLSDGTQVELNAHTNLAFQATDTERRVRLGGGQAFFVVTQDTTRPFIVDTPLGSVRVTGTAFDVRTLTTQNLAITVAEGSVEVRLGENDRRSASAPIKLASHDQLTLNGGEPTVTRLSDEVLANELAWREGQLALDNAPLQEVLARFSHFHGVGISAASDVAELGLSGRFTLADLDNFLLILETVHPVRVIRDQSGTIRVVGRN